MSHFSMSNEELLGQRRVKPNAIISCELTVLSKISVILIQNRTFKTLHGC